MPPSATKVRIMLRFATDETRLLVERRTAWKRLYEKARESGMTLFALLGAYGLPDDMGLDARLAEASRLTKQAAEALEVDPADLGAHSAAPAE